jgi:hypothetical protein
MFSLARKMRSESRGIAMRHVSAVRELVRGVMENGGGSEPPVVAAGRKMLFGEHVNWAAKHIRDHCPLREKQIAAKHFGHFFHAHVKNFDHKKFRRMAGLREDEGAVPVGGNLGGAADPGEETGTGFASIQRQNQ